LFFTCILFPSVIGIFYPGLTHYDEIIGIRALPFRSEGFIFGGVLLILGIYFLLASNMTLVKLGKGTAAFKLTKHLVEGSIYKKLRNPMSLGFYLLCIGISLMAGSTSITLGSLALIIPSHMFNLKYFEEQELEIRYSQPYLRYKQNVPFLIPKLISLDRS
jgi:protein-S-isoprenylcysteine O-methyltransferase Ste14